VRRAVLTVSTGRGTLFGAVSLEDDEGRWSRGAEAVRSGPGSPGDATIEHVCAWLGSLVGCGAARTVPDSHWRDAQTASASAARRSGRPSKPGSGNDDDRLESDVAGPARISL